MTFFFCEFSQKQKVTDIAVRFDHLWSFFFFHFPASIFQFLPLLYLLFIGGDSFLCTSPFKSESLSLKSLSPLPLSLPLMCGSLAEIVVNELPFHIVIGLTVSFPYPGNVQ